MFNGENIETQYFDGINDADKMFFRSFCAEQKIKPEFTEAYFENLISEVKQKRNKETEKKNLPIQLNKNWVLSWDPDKFSKGVRVRSKYESELDRLLSIFKNIKNNIYWLNLPNKDEKIKSESPIKSKLSKQQSRIKELVESKGKNLLTDKFDNTFCLSIANQLIKEGLMKKDCKSKEQSVRNQIGRIKDKLKYSD